jgi:hypothetical protein
MDLVVPTPRGRTTLVALATAVAVLWGALLLVGLPLPGKRAIVIGAGVVLSVIMLRHLLTTETWHVQRNLLERRMKVGPWRYTRSYQYGEFEVVTTSDGEGGTYHCLYVVTEGQRHSLLHRDLPELEALARYLSAQTGWVLRP